jgi:hypothetical protein
MTGLPSPDQKFVKIVTEEIQPLVNMIAAICIEKNIPYAFSVCVESTSQGWKEHHSYLVPGNEKTPAFYRAAMELIEHPELTEDVLLAARRLKN